MNKAILGACALTICAAANAQSSVTIFGVIDAGVGRISATGRGHATGLMAGGQSTGRLGFRGTEDLGGGLAASFWLEGEVQTDTGNANGFNFIRRSTVSLSGNFGEIRMGRDFGASYQPWLSFDPYGQRAFGTIENIGPSAGALTSGGAAASYIRNSNSVSYFLPATLGGLYGSAQYAFGERASNTAATATNSKDQGNYIGAQLGYKSGPLNVGGAYGVYSDVSRNAAYLADWKLASIGASWDFGFVKPMALFQNERVEGGAGLSEFRFNTLALGATAPLSTGFLRATVSRYDNKTSGAASSNDATKFAVGYVYNLSKRTNIYADVGRINNKGGAAFGIGGIGGSISGAVAPVAGGTSTGFGVGVMHAF